MNAVLTDDEVGILRVAAAMVGHDSCVAETDPATGSTRAHLVRSPPGNRRAQHPKGAHHRLGCEPARLCSGSCWWPRRTT